jgi:hypothetical protein
MDGHSRTRAIRAAAVCIAMAARGLVAQQGAAPPPPSVLSGVVRDIAGAPLADVNVSLLGESLATRTDSAGRFVLRDIPAGSHTALFRRIGLRSVDYRWVAQAGRELQVAVAMAPVPRELDRIVVEAPSSSRKRGTSSIGGVVTDSTGAAVIGADVRLLGSGLSTVTDSGGRFEFRMLAAGPYIVRARRHGLSPTSHVLQLADDDNRGITLKLFGLPRRTGARDTASASGYGIVDLGYEDFDRRERGGFAQRVLGPGDLFRENRRPLDLVLQSYRDDMGLSRRASGFVNGGDVTTEGDCLLIDGRRAAYQPLRTYTSVDVQLVEIYRANAFVDEFVISQMDALRECRGGIDRHPSYFVLWTRALR